MLKPDGMLTTEQLQELKENSQSNELWSEIQVCHQVDSSDVYIDDRSGEIICELFGSLTEKPYWRNRE